jgi:hypothetical protein
MFAAIKDYKEWRSYKVPVGQAIRLTWKSKLAILVR